MRGDLNYKGHTSNYELARFPLICPMLNPSAGVGNRYGGPRRRRWTCRRIERLLIRLAECRDGEDLAIDEDYTEVDVAAVV